MSERPFFSVIIPTKNRSHLIGLAIQSVLNQTFSDFEIVISDNDDSDTLTRAAVATFSDPRIKYLRTTGKLSMPDNWEFGLTHASGQYLTILEDKQTFYPDALAIINKVIMDRGESIIIWQNDILDDAENPPLLKKYLGSNRIFTHNSDEILRCFMKNLRFRALPRMINSCVPRSLVEYIRQQTPQKRFFIPVNPDLCAAFMQLNYVDEITSIDWSLCIWGATSLSNAKSVRQKGETAKRFSQDMGDDSLFYNYVPIKSKFLINNLIINDYLKLKQTLGGRLDEYTISPEAYLLACYDDIMQAEKFGTDMTEEKLQWNEFYKSQPLTIQTKVRRHTLQYMFLHYLQKLLGQNLTFRLGAKRQVIPVYGNALDVTTDSLSSK